MEIRWLMAVKMEEKATEKAHWNRRKWLNGLLAVALITVTASALAYWQTGSHFVRARPASIDSAGRVADTEAFMAPHKLNIILMGVDERPQEGDPGRSDTLVVLMIDTLKREASILSVPRDTRVRFRDRGWDKINHAFSFGGVALAQQTTEDFLGIPVDYYAKVNLKSFSRIVDAMGGVNIDVEKRMYYVDTWDHFIIDLQPGIQRLDGRTALQYVRYRSDAGDIARVRRQQKFLKAVLAEMKTIAIIPKLPDIVREAFAALDTNIPLPLMLGLAGQLKDGLQTGLKTYMVEGVPYYINDISYWVPDVMNTSRKVAEMQGVPFSGTILTAAQKQADEYQRNLPASAQADAGADYSAMERPTTASKTTTKAK